MSAPRATSRPAGVRALIAATACFLAPLLCHEGSAAAPGKDGKKPGKARPAASAPASSASGSSAPAVAVASSSALPAPSAANTLAAPPSAGSAGGAPDVLTIARVAVDPSPKTIGTCDPAQREKGHVRFGLAHVSDLHARYGDLIGGRSRYAYIAGLLKQLKAAQPTLVLDAGDDYEKGSLADLRSSGETTRQMIQALPLDVRTIGNHDFAYGETAVLRDLRLSKHPVLAANVRHVGLAPSKQPFRPYARFDVGCVKVGVIGLVTQNYGADDEPSDLPYDGVFVQDDRYSAILEREARAHRAEVDVLVALTHLGYAEDVALARRGGRLVDLVIGGHSEDVLEQPEVVVHPDNTRTWILQAGHHGENVGRGEIVVKLGESRKITIEKYKVVEVNESLPVAEEVNDLARRLQDAVVPDAQAVIGRLGAPLKKGRAISELVWKAAAGTWNVDVMVVGRDLYFAGLPRGDLTLQRLYQAVLVQRQPAGTSGISSIWSAEVGGAEMNALARVFRTGGSSSYEWFGPKEKFDPARRYRIALDKRAVTHPKVLFGPEAKLLRPVFLGEMIDALEAYARARTAKGQPIDGP